MLKKLSILLLTIFMVVPAMAQPEESCECMFAPKAGQWQVDLVLGQGQFFNDFNGLFYILPNGYGAPIGIKNGESVYISGDLATDVYNIGSLNRNNLTNIAGIQGRYFISNRFDINFMGAYNINMQPKKDFIEGVRHGLTPLNFNIPGIDPQQFMGMVGPAINSLIAQLGPNSSVKELLEAVRQVLANMDPASLEKFMENPGANMSVGDVFAHRAILGSVVNSLMTQLGSNCYFAVNNPRISLYAGAFAQFKYARVKASYPAYSGEKVQSLDLDKVVDISTYRTLGRAGQVIGIGGGLDVGVSYALSPGLILSLEVNPVVYQYTLMHLQINGQQPYYASNHNVSAFKYPQLKLGIRF